VRIFYMANNRLGWQVLRWLRDRGEQIVGLAVHPDWRAKCRREIIETAGLRPDGVFDGARLGEPATLAAVREKGPEIGLSVLFGYVLGKEFLAAFPRGCVNLHPGLLPYNRGAHPNVWSIVDRTPAGVTLHWMDESIDTGELIAGRRVGVEPVDTGKTLYEKLQRAALELFIDTWPQIRAGTAPRHPQDPRQGTFHRVADLKRLDEIDLQRTYTGRELIDLLRARTFPPYPGAFFRRGGRKVHVRVELAYEEDLGDANPQRADD